MFQSKEKSDVDAITIVCVLHGKWFQGMEWEWPLSWFDNIVSVKEFFPIVFALNMCQSHLRDMHLEHR